MLHWSCKKTLFSLKIYTAGPVPVIIGKQCITYVTVKSIASWLWKTRSLNDYHPQRSCGKVIFSQASVILSSGGVYSSMHWGRHPPPRQTPRWADTSPCPVHAGIHTPFTVHAGIHPHPAATAADGTHPTGMHSCLEISRTHNNTKYWAPWLMI